MSFKDSSQFKTPEALIVYQQKLLSDEELLRVCIKEYGRELHTPAYSYVPKEIADLCLGNDCVPIAYDVHKKILQVGILPEKNKMIHLTGHIQLETIEVPIYYYVNLYTRYFGTPDFLAPISVVDKFAAIVDEAITFKASDITITTVASGALIYYNCRKKKVYSRCSLTVDDVEQMAIYLASLAGTPITETGNKPKYFSVKLDMHNRGRVVLNKTYYGRAITIRVLPDEVLTTSLEELNIVPSVINFIRSKVLSKEKGLRLFIGETMSGKNTTILSALRELVAEDTRKIVSIESPVEILVDGIEQINVETEEEYNLNASSLLRQNPDIVYIAEITDATAVDTINVSNTGKAVFSTLHANSISDVIARLQDITKMSSDRLLISLHSVVYQELVRDEENDKVYPLNRYMYFSDDLKKKLYGKSLGEIKTILIEKEQTIRESSTCKLYQNNHGGS